MPMVGKHRFAAGALFVLLSCTGVASTAQVDALADQLRSGKDRTEREAAALALVALDSDEAKDALVAIVADPKAKANAREIALAKLATTMVGRVAARDVMTIVTTHDYRTDVYNATLQLLAPAVRLDEPTIMAVLEVYRAGERKSGVLICCQAQHAKYARDPAQKALLDRVIGPFLLAAARAPAESVEVLDYLGWCLVEYGLPGGPEVLIRSLREQLATGADGDVGMAKHAIDLLAQVSGRATGLPAGHADQAQIAAAIPAWLAWWEAEKDHDGYRLPAPGK